MVSEPNTTSMSSSRSASRSKSSMLLEKVIALRVVKPVNRSSQPAFSQPASSARKTVSGLPAGSGLVSVNRSSGMTHPPYQARRAEDIGEPWPIIRHPRRAAKHNLAPLQTPGVSITGACPAAAETPRPSRLGQGLSRRPGVDQLDASILEIGQISGSQHRPMRLSRGGDHGVLDRDRLACCLAVSANLAVVHRAFATEGQNLVRESDLEQRCHAGRQIVATAAGRHARKAILDFGHADGRRIDAVRQLLSQETDNGGIGGRTNKLGDDIRVEQDHRSSNSGGGVSGARPRGGVSSSAPCSGPNSRWAISTILSRASVSSRASAVRNNSRASSSSERRRSAARALSRLCKALSTFRISKLTTRPPLRRC